jgi:hypothetical protein
LTELPDKLPEQIFDLLNIDGIDSISQADLKLLTLVQETGFSKKRLYEFHSAWNDKWN